MEKVEIHRGWLEKADGLPQICLKTGTATGGKVQKRKLMTAPSWAAIFIVLGALPYVLIRMAMGEQITMYVPRTAASVTKSRLLTGAGWLAMFVGFMVFVVGAGGSSSVGMIGGGLIMVASIAFLIWVRRTCSVGVKMKHKDPTVRLSGVHPVAAAALHRHISASLATTNTPPPPMSAWTGPVVPGGITGR
jgi:hypothetical protein